MQRTASSSGKRFALWLMLGLLVPAALVMLACGDTAANAGTTTSSSSSSSSSSKSTASKHFKVGDQVKVGSNWVVTVNSVQTNPGTDVDQPQKAGDTFLVVNVSLKNVSSQEQDLSSLLQFTLKDSTGQKYDQTVTTFASSSPDGKVEAGDTSKGDIVYEVPQSQKAYTLAFEADVISSGQTIWDLSL